MGKSYQVQPNLGHDHLPNPVSAILERRSTAGPSQRPRSFSSGGGFVLPPTRAPSGFPLLSEDSFARQVENSLEKIRDILNDNKVNIYTGWGLSSLRFGMFNHHAWAVGSYSSGPPAWELSKSKSTQPRSAGRCPTLYTQ